MTTEITASWNPALTTIIQQALLNVGAINEDEAVPPNAYADCFIKINAMVKEWMASGLHVWTEQEAIVFLQPGQARYPIGGSVETHTSDAEDWALTELTYSAVSGATTITVEDVDGITDGLNIGIVLDDGTTLWTTVDGTPVGDVVTLDDALTGDAGSENAVFYYTDPILRPLRIPNARLLQFLNLNETVMTPMSRQEYMDQPNKFNRGVPTMFFYTPQLVSGLLYVWPPASNSNYAVRFTWYRPIFDFDDPANTADFPQEWANAIMWSLAKEIGPGYGVPDAMWQRIVAMAESKLDLVANYDRESEPIQFGYDFQGR